MSSESNKYVNLKVKIDTRKQIKIESAKKGSSMDDYLKSLLAKDIKPIREEINKEINNKKKGGFSIGF